MTEKKKICFCRSDDNRSITLVLRTRQNLILLAEEFYQAAIDWGLKPISTSRSKGHVCMSFEPQLHLQSSGMGGIIIRTDPSRKILITAVRAELQPMAVSIITAVFPEAIECTRSSAATIVPPVQH